MNGEGDLHLAFQMTTSFVRVGTECTILAPKLRLTILRVRTLDGVNII